jgi:NRAMP (natural resistance-associated macrophage protein)-like metal ion transporter
MAHGVTQPVQDAPPGEPARPAPRRGWRARLRASPAWLDIAALGPGLVAAAAGNDAGGIATYATAGARYGYSLLWAMVLIVISLSLVQEMCARMGAVTGKGLSDLIRERFGLRWATLATLALLIANGGTTITEFVGIGAAAEIFGIPRWIAVPLMALLIWRLVTLGSYGRLEKIFLVMTAVFFSYVLAVFLAHPDWNTVLKSTVTPTFHLDPSFLNFFVALIGTTITPYIQLYTQASVVEKGVTPSDYRYERFEVIVGVLFASVVSSAIIISTAAAIFVPHGSQSLDSAADAARALQPVGGAYAEYLFAVGLFGASMLAGAVLPLSTAYAVTESIGFERGVSFTFRDAPVFVGLFTALVILGALVAMIPGVPVVTLLLVVQVINGVLLPIELFFIMRLINDKQIMGRYANGRLYNVVAWTAVLAITLAVLLMLGTLPFAGG